jgi:hypothetical protein
MPCVVSWYNQEKAIVLYTISDPWTWEEVLRSPQEINQLIHADGRAEYDLITHLATQHWEIRGAFTTLQKLGKGRDPRVKYAALVGGTNPAISFLRHLRTIYPFLASAFTYGFATDFADAEALIAQVRNHRSSFQK